MPEVTDNDLARLVEVEAVLPRSWPQIESLYEASDRGTGIGKRDKVRYLIFVGSLLGGGTAMNGVKSYQIGRHKITLALREDVGPVSPYSLLLAENIPDLTGQTVVDVESGSGFLSIVARLQGATRVYLLDTYESAIALALENAERNGVREGLIHLPIGSSMILCPRESASTSLLAILLNSRCPRWKEKTARSTQDRKGGL